MKRLSLLLFVVCCAASLAAQQIALADTVQRMSKILLKQRQMFPQEKVYVMTDRDLYISGDTVWMRPWIYDCNTRKTMSRSKYVYVELRDAADNLKKRVKVINNDGKMDGYIPLAPDLMSGDYTLCAYTYYMTGTTDEMYFKKRLHIMRSSDVKQGLYPKNLTVNRSNLSLETAATWNSMIPAGAAVAVSVTNDRLCLSDSTSSVVWSMKHQPDLFSTEGIKKAGVYYSPTVPYEIGQTISGTVFGNYATKKPQHDIKMSFMVPSKKILDVKVTDAKGHFLFQGFNLPDSTLVYLTGRKSKNVTMENITLDDDSLPDFIHPLQASPRYFLRKNESSNTDFKIVSSTIDIANSRLLAELVVKGKKKEKPGDEFDNRAAHTLKASDFEKMNCYDVRSALRLIPGLIEKVGAFYYRNKPVNIYVDNFLDTDNSNIGEDDNGFGAIESAAMNYPIEIVDRIDLLRPEDSAFLTGGGGSGCPAINITLKEGSDVSKYSESSVKVFYPLGYQEHKDFTPHAPDKPWPLLYWNPYVTVDGSTTISDIVRKVLPQTVFMDSSSSYTIHIDGFMPDGTPVYEQVTFTR